MKYQFNDGGRAQAGYKGLTGDCVCRAICIAAQLPYQEVYNRLAEGNKTQRRSKRDRAYSGRKTASHGISVKRKWFQDYMKSLGFVWVPTMFVGQGCKIHMKAEELPSGRLVCALSRHYVAVIDGVLHDTYDSSRDENRCVYGYFHKP